MGCAPGDYTQLRLRATAGDRVAKHQYETQLECNRECSAARLAALKLGIRLGDPNAIAERDRINAQARARRKRRGEVRAEEEAARAAQGLHGVNGTGGAGEHVGTVEGSGVLGDSVSAVDWDKVFAFYGRAQRDEDAEASSAEDQDDIDRCDSDWEDQPVEETAVVDEDDRNQAIEVFDPKRGINLSYPTTRLGEEMQLEDFAYHGKVYARADLKSAETIQMEALRQEDKFCTSKTWQEGLTRRWGDSLEDE